MNKNEDDKRIAELKQHNPDKEMCPDVNATPVILTDDNIQTDEIHNGNLSELTTGSHSQTDFNFSNNLLSLLDSNKGMPTKELAERCALTINTANSLVRLALFLVWYTRSFTVYGCKNMKEFIQQHTIITYDAGIKQLEAAKICAELFGLKRMGDFSDNSLRTIARLPFSLRSRVLDEICKECNVDRERISKRQFTAKKIEITTRKVTGRNFFNKSFKCNYISREVYDKDYVSTSITFLDENSHIHGVDEVNVNDGLDVNVINVEVDYSNVNLNQELRFKYSELELYEVIREVRPDFYNNHVYDKGLSRSELILIIVSLGQKHLDEDVVVDILNSKYREEMFASKEDAYSSLRKYSRKILFLLINILDERGLRQDSFDILPSINEVEFSTEELIDLIVNKYCVFDDYDYLKYAPACSEEDEDEEDEEDEDDEDDIYESVEALLEQPFFVDTDSNDVMESYEKSRIQLQESIDRKVYDDFLLKNPKAGVLMALVDELALEELDLARLYIEFTYDKLAEESSLDAEHGTIEEGDN